MAAAGNQLTGKRADNGVTSYQYDAMNRRTKATDPPSQIPQMSCDAASNLTTLTDARSNAHAFVCDLRDSVSPIDISCIPQKSRSQYILCAGKLRLGTCWMFMGLLFLTSADAVAKLDRIGNLIVTVKMREVAEAIQGVSKVQGAPQLALFEAKQLKGLTFISSPAIIDYQYKDTIVDVGGCKVLRREFNFVGAETSRNVVSLMPREFWRRIEILCHYREHFGFFPIQKEVNDEQMKDFVERDEKVNGGMRRGE